ncbi:MAG: alkaline phosphatase family protein [Candidatus Omnitrophica bacterium]|nr:alkaline phosphatase family protein [Candidatus Omnitrophota bacterium]
MIYIDGLRPDNVDEMVREGKLPNIKRLFYDGGLRFQNFFTTFPSNTIIANGVFLSGKWPEQTGLKTQSFFERFEVRRPNFLKRLWQRKRYPHYDNLLMETDVAPGILKEFRARTLYNYLGNRFHFTVVPISPYTAPPAWPHVAANTVEKPYQVTAEAAKRLDDINAAYARRYMASDLYGRVFWVWFPDMDHEQHADEWGQFGKIRESLIDDDRMIGEIYDAMNRGENKGKTYIILFSDHGAYGGRNGVYNQPYYLGRDFFYKTLKMNVRGPDYSMTHPGTDSKSFAFVDNMGRGHAEIYLPVKNALSRDWSRPNTLYELEHYGFGPNRKPLNLVEALLKLNLSSQNERPAVDPRPVEFLMLKLSEELIYLARKDGSQALIRTRREGSKVFYRYLPVKYLKQDENGKIEYKEAFSQDPLGYLKSAKFHPEGFDTAEAFLKEEHSPNIWLKASYETDFPDAVTAIAKFLNWSPKLSYLAKARDPDMIVSSAEGWNFRIEPIKGADHGSLARDSMRATFMISGPNIRKGVVEEPHRIIELAPTVLHMIGYAKKTDFEANAIRDLYEP